MNENHFDDLTIYYGIKQWKNLKTKKTNINWLNWITDWSRWGLHEKCEGHCFEDPAEHRVHHGERHQDLQPRNHQRSQKQNRQSTKAAAAAWTTGKLFEW